VFNKIDRLVNRNVIGYLTANHPDAVFVSATRGIRMSALREHLVSRLDAQVVEQTLTVKAADYRTIARLHETAEILEKSYDGETITIRYRIRKLLADRMAGRK
jgi:GTP-binding protein HflX